MDRTRMPWEPDSDGALGVPEDGSRHAGYAVGSTVYSGDCRGTVVTVGETTMGVVWSDSDDGKPITYPIDAPYLRGAMPWE